MTEEVALKNSPQSAADNFGGPWNTWQVVWLVQNDYRKRRRKQAVKSI